MPSYFDLQNAPVLTTPSALTAPKITSIGYPGDDTAADPAGGQTITLTGAGFEAGASVIVNGNAVGVVSVVSSTTITFTSPAQSAGSYPIYVVNTDGGTAIAVPGIQYSGAPTWTTAAGSLGSYTETVAIANTVTATGDAPITYSVFSGSLPTGATLNSANGYISGTSPAAASPTTYTFTIRATDAQQQDTNRQFSLTINPDVVTWSSPANGTTYTSVANSALANVPLSANAASGQNITYTANALPTGLSISGSNITGTPTVVANSSTLLTATAATTNATATRTINWVISVANDPFFPYVTSLLSASTPASTFVTDASTNAFNVTVNGDTRPSNFGPYTPGYYSGLFAGASNQTVTIATAANSNIGAIAGTRITYEYWFYCTTIQAITAWYVGIFGNFQAVAANGRIAFGIRGSSATSPVEAYFYWTTSTSTTDIVATTATVNQNSWNHVAVSIDATAASNSTITIYLNGVGETFTGKNLSTHTTDPGIAYAIGGDYSFQNFTGYLSNFRVTRGTTVYSGNFTPSTTPFTANANTVLLALQSNRFIDTSTNAYALTPNSGPQISGFDPFVPSGSFAGRGSGFFDGSSDYLTLPNNAAFAFGTGAYTVEAWIYATESQAYAVIFTAGVNGLQFGIDASGYIAIAQTNVNFELNSTTTMPLNQWNHVAVSRNGASVTSIFLNGSRIASGTVSTNYSSATGYINLNPYNSNDFTGYFSNLRVVKGTAVYDPTQTTITVPTTPLTAIANTSLLTLQNNQPNNNSMFLDASTNNFNITRNGNTTQGSFSPYGGGWSAYFDGTGDTLTLASNAAFGFGTGNFTIELWVYCSFNGAIQEFIDARSSDTAQPWVFGINGTGLARTYDGTTIRTGGQLNANAWNHVAWVRVSNVNTVYVNGVSGHTWTASQDFGSSKSLVIGNNVGPTNEPFTGYMSNLRIVKGTAVYTSTFTPPTAPLTPIANTSLLTCADNRFIDDSPNNFTVTRNGDTSIQRFNPFNPVLTTPTSYSGFFDGTGDYLSLAANSAFDITSGDFTVEMWIYRTANGAEQYLWSNRADTPARGWEWRINSTNLMQFFFTGGSSLTSTGTVPTNTWTHLAVSRQTNTVRFFINGALDSSTTFSNGTAVTTSLFLGYSTSGGGYLTGYMSNARLVKGTAVYTAAFTPSTTPLTAIANTTLLTLQSATFTDNSTNNFTITNNGDTAPRQFNPFGWTSTTGSSAAYTPTLYGGSAYFDGTGDSLSLAGNSIFTLGAQPNDFTIECWVYLTTTPGNYAAFMTTWTDASTNYTNRWFLGIASSKITWYNDAGTFAIQDSVNVPLNQWIHVAAVRSGSTITLYKNGVSLGTQTTGQAYTTNGGLTMGYAGSNSNYITGYISDARIFRGTALYKSNFQPPIAPLTALQNTVLLNNMTGAGIYDSSMMANYETVGNASINTAFKKYGNTSMYFDGTGDYLVAPATNLPLTFGTGDFTIECWIYPASVNSSTITIVSNRFDAGADTVLFFGFGTTHGLYFHTQNTVVLNSGVNATVNTWQHVALCRASGTVRIFLNGTQVGSSASSAQNLSATVPVFVGQDGTKTTGIAAQYNGYIDDFRITKGVARYTSNFTPTSTPFITN